MTAIAMTAAREQIAASKLPDAVKAKGFDYLDRIAASDAYKSDPHLGQHNGLLEDEGVTYAMTSILEAAIMGKPHVNVRGKYDATCNAVLAEIRA